jgi:transposase InsO family protein
VRLVEMRRQHPRWGAKRIRMELLKTPSAGETVPAVATINRILIRLGLVRPRKRKRPKDSYQRWQRPGPMQLWQLDIVGGVWLVNEANGEMREAKVVTGVDDHSRYCVSARVVERATGRQVCLAFAQALVRFGIPEEVLSDNGKQFTDRFGKGGEVLFDKICRHNGITHRLTQPASPTTTGKVERFHLTLRRELLDDHEPFTSLEEAQAAVDAWVEQYNVDRPHQALDAKRPSPPETGSRRCPTRSGNYCRSGCPRRWLPHPPPLRVGRKTLTRTEQPIPPPAGRPARLGRVDQLSWTRSCRRRETCCWPGNRSGSARPAPVRWCGCGPTAT